MSEWNAILKSIERCWVKLPLKPKCKGLKKTQFIWEEFRIKLTDTLIELSRETKLKRYHRVIATFKCDVKLKVEN
jgi:hypothetical protein